MLALDIANSVILRHDPIRSIDRFSDEGQMRDFAGAATAFCAEKALFGTLLPVAVANRDGFLAMREAVDGFHRQRIASGGSEDETQIPLANLLSAIAHMLRVGLPGSLETATALSALRTLSDEATSRMKVCGHCGWLFIDRSRNRSRMWCDMAVCGNRAKARRHYQRIRTGLSSAPTEDASGTGDKDGRR